ncbi:hypothetical protein G6F31_017192 [Rhizopus arrhizus]|nr:hypothetical protein G6F31_017192 [Rhizopus arrhizus]
MRASLSMSTDAMSLPSGVAARRGASRPSRSSMRAAKRWRSCWPRPSAASASVVQPCRTSRRAVHSAPTERNRRVITTAKPMPMNIAIDELRKVWMLAL